THFNNATFKPGVQQPGAEGLWNPKGSGSWRLIGCTVTSAMFADGTIAASAADDPVIGLAIAEGGGPPAKLVDLDPEQQMVSQIWGLQVTLGKSGASPACSGKFEVAAFSDI